MEQDSKGFLYSVYRDSLALLTDLYELTMAYGYWKKGMAHREAAFHLFFRKQPFNGAFAIAAGLETAMQLVENFHYSPSDLAYLEQLRGTTGEPLFEKGFLDMLSGLCLTCDIDAVPEGTVVFPQEPLIRVQGPLLHAQLLESPLLNIINFQSLIATKAARICWAARPDPVVEFGMRRAQGIDGAISASRAAFIGGCESTSHVLAGKLFGLPVKGTHAHSWIMAFEEEESAFEAYAEVMPRHCIFLVDTYNSIQGVERAIKVGRNMREKGFEMAGIRLDSGDLARLSIEARRLLDEGGFPHAKIMASNELDEQMITDLKLQGAKIDVWGVGTHLVTGKDQSALDGVYKLSAIKDVRGKWCYKLKVSDQFAKITHPGLLQVRRFFNAQGNVADVIYHSGESMGSVHRFWNPLDPTHMHTVSNNLAFRDLLVPVVQAGRSVYASPSLPAIREKALHELSALTPGMRRFLNPESFTVGLEESLYAMKLQLIEQQRGKKELA